MLLIYVIKHVINMCNDIVRVMAELGSMLIYCIGAACTKTQLGFYAEHLLTVNLQCFVARVYMLFHLSSGESFLWS